MKKSVFTAITLLVAFTHSLTAQNNPELQRMADEDQSSRASTQIDWNILSREDSLRRVRVFELIKENRLATAQDHLNAGIIFQHGNDTIASSMAVKSFEKALQLDPNLNRWWYAAAVDRHLMRKGQPQIYGTQFIKNNDKWKRYEIDTAKITDEQRKYYHVETLKEQDEKIRTLNLIPLSIALKGKSSDEAIAFLKTEYKKGISSQYAISEAEINTLAYQWASEKNDEGALKLFQLNTLLYPKAWNTYDSYGEQLLKLGYKKKALKNYRKSLALHPQNENARAILEQEK